MQPRSARGEPSTSEDGGFRAPGPQLEDRLSSSPRATLLVLSALAYGTMFVGGPALRRWARAAAGHPPYEGPWGLVEHALLYTTLTAVTCAIVWWGFARAGWMPGPRSVLRARPARRMLGWGLAAGTAVCAVTVSATFALHRAGLSPAPALRFHAPNGWLVAGNLFSNFYEDFIYAGFLLGVVRRVAARPWIPMLVTSAIFGASHVQYPLALRALIAITAAIAFVPRARTGSIVPVWIAHVLSDVLLDSFL